MKICICCSISFGDEVRKIANSLPDMSYINDEIRAFGVKVLDGDLSEIDEG